MYENFLSLTHFELLHMLNESQWGPSRSNPNFESNLKTLLASYRSLIAHSPSNHKIIHIRHASTAPTSILHPSQPGHAFQSLAAPLENEISIVKNVNSSFIGTNLEELVREHGTQVLYIAGLSTDHCVSTTTRMAGNLHVCGEGEVVLLQDATAAWKKSEEGFEAEVVHAVNVESLREFASVRDVKDVVANW